jgi:hypothetical protein
MDITILIERNGIRAYTTVNSEATRIPGVHRIRWVGSRIRNYTDFYSLVHVATGRSCNKSPLTMEESERLVDALLDCPIGWDYIDPDERWPGKVWYTNRLTEEAANLAGRY